MSLTLQLACVVVAAGCYGCCIWSANDTILRLVTVHMSFGDNEGLRLTASACEVSSRSCPRIGCSDGGSKEGSFLGYTKTLFTVDVTGDFCYCVVVLFASLVTLPISLWLSVKTIFAVEERAIRERRNGEELRAAVFWGWGFRSDCFRFVKNYCWVLRSDICFVF